MLTAERRQHILEVLRVTGKVLAPDISTALGVSEDTIRRDLRDLAAAGLLRRVHGGALPLSPGMAEYHTREAQDHGAKESIARVAAGLVQNGQVVILDGGTTTLEVARQLAPDLRATVLTNSPPVALALVEHPWLEVVLLGGRLRRELRVTTGAGVVDDLRRVRADLCILGVCGVHHELGVTVADYEEAQVKRAMVECAADTVGLAAAGKVGTTGPFLVTGLEGLTYLVTDASQEAIAPYRAAGVTVLTA